MYGMTWLLQLYMYALNTPKNGKLRGLTGADYACYKEAYYSGMHGRTFRAFLASKTQNLYSIVSDRNIPIVNKNVRKILHFSWYSWYL